MLTEAQTKAAKAAYEILCKPDNKNGNGYWIAFDHLYPQEIEAFSKKFEAAMRAYQNTNLSSIIRNNPYPEED